MKNKEEQLLFKYIVQINQIDCINYGVQDYLKDTYDNFEWFLFYPSYS